MPTAASLIKRISAAIKKVGPTARVTSKRITVMTGGDELIGVDGTVTNYDTKFDPQPVYRQLGHRQAMFMSTTSVQLVADDYKFTFPVTQVSEADFQDPRVRIVMADANGEEVLRILYMNTEQFGGSDVVLVLFARSIGHYGVPESALGTPVGSPNVTVQEYLDSALAQYGAGDNTDIDGGDF